MTSCYKCARLFGLSHIYLRSVYIITCTLHYFELTLVTNFIVRMMGEFFVCSCFLTNNYFLKEYKCHVTYHSDEHRFSEEWRDVGIDLSVFQIFFILFKTIFCWIVIMLGESIQLHMSLLAVLYQ